MKFYIAGKITGDKNYKKKFAAAEKAFRKLGHSVMNPAWIVASEEFSWLDYMKVSNAMQSVCEATYFLEDWMDSTGAVQEMEYAKSHNHIILFESEVFELAGSYRHRRKRKF